MIRATAMPVDDAEPSLAARVAALEHRLQQLESPSVETPLGQRGRLLGPQGVAGDDRASRGGPVHGDHDPPVRTALRVGGAVRVQRPARRALGAARRSPVGSGESRAPGSLTRADRRRADGRRASRQGLAGHQWPALHRGRPPALVGTDRGSPQRACSKGTLRDKAISPISGRLGRPLRAAKGWIRGQRPRGSWTQVGAITDIPCLRAPSASRPS